MTIHSRYTYDPLDRLASRTPLAEAIAQRFYKAGQLVTEIQGAEQRTYLRSDSQILVQKNQSASTLLATDTQKTACCTPMTPPSVIPPTVTAKPSLDCLGYPVSTANNPTPSPATTYSAMATAPTTRYSCASTARTA